MTGKNYGKTNVKVSELEGDDVIIIPSILPKESNARKDTLSSWKERQWTVN